MARPVQLHLLILVAALGLTAHAQEPPPDSPPGETETVRPRRPRDRDEMRRQLEQLPPEQREHFRKNLERWEKLSPEQRDRLRERNERRMREMQKEAESALTETGLKLDDEQRTQFIRRYMRERRGIEETVRRESDARREALLAALLERLKSKFAP